MSGRVTGRVGSWRGGMHGPEQLGSTPAPGVLFQPLLSSQCRAAGAASLVYLLLVQPSLLASLFLSCVPTAITHAAAVERSEEEDDLLGALLDVAGDPQALFHVLEKEYKVGGSTGWTAVKVER